MEENFTVAISASEFWKAKFGENPTTDSDKLAIAMMQEYAQYSLRFAYKGFFKE